MWVATTCRRSSCCVPNCSARSALDAVLPARVQSASPPRKVMLGHMRRDSRTHTHTHTTNMTHIKSHIHTHTHTHTHTHRRQEREATARVGAARNRQGRRAHAGAGDEPPWDSRPKQTRSCFVGAFRILMCFARVQGAPCARDAAANVLQTETLRCTAGTKGGLGQTQKSAGAIK